MLFLTISVVIISIVGTISHFLYDISNHNKIIGLFTSVNESTWEHVKIALTPTIFWSLIDGIIYGINPNYFFSKAISLLSIIILMPVLFYGFKYLFKKNNFIVDILIFYVVIICSQYLFYIGNLYNFGYFVNYFSLVVIFVIFGFYLLLTLLPIKNFLFIDPITNKYGFNGHKD